MAFTKDIVDRGLMTGGEAIEVAARIPDGRRGSIEARPVMEADMPS